MPPPSFVAVSAIAASTGADVTVTLPSHQANDVFLLAGFFKDILSTVTVSGWTELNHVDNGSAARYYFFWKRAASAAETNPLFHKSGATAATYAAVAVFRNCITTGNPYNATNFAAVQSGDPAVINQLTSVVDNSLIAAMLMGEDDNNASVSWSATSPSSLTDHYLSNATGTGGMIDFGEGVQATLGATGNFTADFNVGNPVGWGEMILALTPVAAPRPSAVNFQNPAIA